MHELRNYSIKNNYGYCNDCKSAIELNTPNHFVNIYKTPSDFRYWYGRVNRLTRYSLTYLQYLELLDSQHHACAICEQLFTKQTRPSIDHDHTCCPDITSCGKCVRGLLCNFCNSGLGNFKDSINNLKQAVIYLSKH